MADDSTLYDAVTAAIAQVVSDIAAGKNVTEWREGTIVVKRESPSELLKALRTIRDGLSPGSSGSGRSASVGFSYGAQ